MEEEQKDYDALRMLPVSMLSVVLIVPIMTLITIAIVLGSFYMTEALENGTSLVLNTLFSIGVTLGYFSIIAALVCFYRLYGLTKWFWWAELAFICHLLVSMFSQIVIWMNNCVYESIFLTILTYVLAFLPDVCVVFGMMFLLRAIGEMCQGMEDKEGMELCARWQRRWTVFQSIRFVFLFFGYVVLFFIEGSDVSKGINLFGNVIFGISAVLLMVYMGMGIRVYGKIRDICQVYYLYLWNHKQSGYYL